MTTILFIRLCLANDAVDLRPPVVADHDDATDSRSLDEDADDENNPVINGDALAAATSMMSSSISRTCSSCPTVATRFTSRLCSATVALSPRISSRVCSI
jgi:hypothetical protein